MVEMEQNRERLEISAAPCQTPVELTRVLPRGLVRWAFWGLRLYIAVMLVLVGIGFSRGMH